MGAEQLVSHQHFDTLQDVLLYLQKEHPQWHLIGMETTDNSIEYTQMDYASLMMKTIPNDNTDDDAGGRGCVLILGNEVTGIDPDIMTQLDSIVEIPMFGSKNSLNVAACAPGTAFVPAQCVCFVDTQIPHRFGKRFARHCCSSLLPSLCAVVLYEIIRQWNVANKS